MAMILYIVQPHCCKPTESWVNVTWIYFNESNETTTILQMSGCNRLSAVSNIHCCMYSHSNYPSTLDIEDGGQNTMTPSPVKSKK